MGHTGSAAPTPLRLPQRATRQDSAAFLGVATFSVMPPTPTAPAHQGSRREGSAMDSENPSSSKSGLRVFKRESNKLFKKSAPVNNPIFFRETHQGHTKVNFFRKHSPPPQNGILLPPDPANRFRIKARSNIFRTFSRVADCVVLLSPDPANSRVAPVSPLRLNFIPSTGTLSPTRSL